MPGNNTTNVVMGNISVFGSFSAGAVPQVNAFIYNPLPDKTYGCLLYTSDAADERSSVDLGGRRIIKKKKHETTSGPAIYTHKNITTMRQLKHDNIILSIRITITNKRLCGKPSHKRPT